MAVTHHGVVPFKGMSHLCLFGDNKPDRFGRLFQHLPPLYLNPTLLHEIGKAGGVMEDTGLPNLTKNVAAGLIFFGQFVDHDITLDASSSLRNNNEPDETANVRTPSLDLDCIYGDGPEAHPYLYDGDKLLTGSDYADPGNPNDLRHHDLPRTPKGTAIIGDPRNDENRVISQMQLAMLRFHNTVYDKVHSEWEEARRVTTWHYQWLVVNEFLRTICGDWVVDDILANGRKVYRPECDGSHGAYIPIEFATAAYRFGHTMIPQKMRVQPGGAQHVLFSPTSALGRGFSPVASADGVVDWESLFDSGNGDFERAGQMDTKLASALLDLPFMDPSTPAFERSLAVRNLLRAQSFLVPSGEQVAECMAASGASEITAGDIAKVREAGAKLGLPKATPLWLYLLAEGRVIGRMDGEKSFSKGEGLGPVGARLVAEVIIGLLELDHRSFLGSNRNWSPLDSADKGGSNGVTSIYQMLTA